MREAINVTFPRPGAAVVALKGEHDRDAKDEAEHLLSQLVDEQDLVVVDVSEATFIDSSFLHNLVLADKRARLSGSQFRLQMGTAPIVRAALEISGLLQTLSVASTREEALAERSDRDAPL
jgi:anti-sigma B factor antagonist